MSEENKEKRARRSKEEINESKTSYERLAEKFQEKYLKRRILNEGTKDERVIEYIGGDKVVERLNNVLGVANWSFTISDRIVDVDIGHIAVLGRLEAIVDGVATVKEQWGSSVIETYSNGRVVCLGDNIKAATTDALKKCATLVGVGLYLYDSESMKFPDVNCVIPGGKEKNDKINELRSSVNKKASKAQVSTIIKIIKDNEISESDVKERYGVENFSEMSNSSASEFIVKWREIFSKQESNSDSKS